MKQITIISNKLSLFKELNDELSTYFPGVYGDYVLIVEHRLIDNKIDKIIKVEKL